MGKTEDRYNSFSSGKRFYKALAEAQQIPQKKLDLEKIISFINHETHFRVTRGVLVPGATFYNPSGFRIVGVAK